MAVDGSKPALDLGIAGLEDARRIGRGGFATVFAARDVDFDRWVAVKILDLVDDAGRRRFDREIRIMGRLSRHRNVVTPYRAGYNRRGHPFVVMELVEGGSLLDLIRRQGPLDWEQAIDYLLPIADAIGHAHDQGIHHRDVKPANILIADGVPQLSDFGIAAVPGGHGTSEVALSLYYSAPETFVDTGHDRDHRSDLYSLAATLYTLIAGCPPFGRDSDNPGFLMHRIETQPVPPIERVPARLNQFFRRALAKSPTDRPDDAYALVDELLAVRGRAIPRANGPGAEPTATPEDRHDEEWDIETEDSSSSAPSPFRRLAAGSIAIFAVLAAGLFALVRLSDAPATTADTASAAADPGSSQPTATSSTGPAAVAGQQATIARGEQSKVFTPGEAVWDVIVLPDGRVAAAADRELQVWDPDDLRVATTTFVGHSAPIHTLAMLADGTIASAASDGTTQLWRPDDETDSATIFQGHRSQVQDLVQLVDGRVASAGLDEALQIWNPNDIEQVDVLRRPFTDVWSLAVLDDGRLAAGSGDHLIRIISPDRPDEPPLVLGGHDSVVIDLAVLADRRLASAALDSTVRLWDPDQPEAEPLVYRRHSGPVQAVVGLPDGRVASAGTDLAIHVWNPDRIEAEPLVLLGHDDAITSLAVLPDGRLASGSADGTVRLWRLGLPPTTGR